MSRKDPPPLFLNSDPGSFAQETFLHRIIDILEHTVEANAPERAVRENTDRLRMEILTGSVMKPFGREPVDLALFERKELAVWMRLFDRYRDRTWLEMGFYEAEAAFYLKLLVAFGYYDNCSPRFLRDPFYPIKREETETSSGGMGAARDLCRVLSSGEDTRRIQKQLLYASLWGNRIDFSLRSIVERERKAKTGLSGTAEGLLIDHSEEVVGALSKARRVDIILDNAGTELVSDLFLSLLLLTRGDVQRVHLHHKKHPIYVSDALIDDTLHTLDLMARHDDEGVQEAAQSIQGLLEVDRLALKDHYFWNGPLTFSALPRRLKRELAGADLVLLKGDANHRRLLDDRRWPSDTPMEEVTGYFPAPFATLRTFKSEMVVDMDDRMVARLSGEDPEWRVNGKRGVIRFVNGRTAG